ncbi:MAG: hypothetical protein M4579_000049 [Chaenotheca gracillima]|nr:MAG: hypothetical protein M4579_000049 [Chaenotheca gracillima]
MAWGWWASGSSGDTLPPDGGSSSDAHNENNRTPSPPSATAPSSTSQPTKRTLTRDEQADLELQSFLSALQSQSTTTSSSTPNHTPPSDPSDSSSSSLAAGTTPPPADPSALYPSTMSCTSCFDQAFYCYSVGGQFMNVYRYGELRDCSELWGQFWFCMRARAQPTAEREEMVRAFYRKKVAEKYKVPGKRSSEDVWEGRTEGVVDAFTLGSGSRLRNGGMGGSS